MTKEETKKLQILVNKLQEAISEEGPEIQIHALLLGAVVIANTLEINDLLKEGVTGKIMLHGVLDEIYKHIFMLFS